MIYSCKYSCKDLESKKLKIPEKFQHFHIQKKRVVYYSEGAKNNIYKREKDQRLDTQATDNANLKLAHSINASHLKMLF